MFLGTFLGNRTAFPNSLRILADRVFNSVSPRNFSIFILLVIGYCVTGKFGQQVAAHGTDVTVFWPPTGISLAALLILGRRFWPAIFLGALFVNVTTTHDVFASLGIASGNTFEAFAGAYLIQRYAQGTKAFYRVKDVVLFAFFAGVLVTALSATIGVSILCYSGFSNWRDFLSVWLTWWGGDAIAALVVTPFLVLLLGNEHHALHLHEVAELLVLLLGLFTISVCIFGPPAFGSPNFGALVVVCIPFLIWAAFRFCPLEAAGANLVLSGVVIWSTATGLGPFAATKEAPLLLGLFVTAITTTTLLLSAFHFQRRSLEGELTAAVVLYKSKNDELSENLTEIAASLDMEVAKHLVARRVIEQHRQMVHEAVHDLPRVICVIDVTNRQILYVDPLCQDALNKSWKRLRESPNPRVGPLEVAIDRDEHRLFNQVSPSSGRELYEERYQVVDADGTRKKGHQVTYVVASNPRAFQTVSIEITG